MIHFWFKRPLWQRIFVGFILGIAAGIAFGRAGSVLFKPFGDFYLSLVRMIVIPLVFFSVTASIARLSHAENIARLGLRTLLWFLLTSLLASLVGVLFGYGIEPGSGLTHLTANEIQPRVIPGIFDAIVGIIPQNPIKAMADSNVLQVLFFASLVGAALVLQGENTKNIHAFIVEGETLIFSLIRGILQLTPIGTFGLIASVVGEYGVSSLLPLGKFVVAIYSACLFHIIVVYGVLLKIHGLSVGHFFQSVLAAQQMAFATCSSIATLPMSVRVAIERLGVPQGYASFAIPLGATLKMDGCGAIYPVIASLFVAQYFGIDLTLNHYIIICLTAVFGSLGTAGVPGTSIVILTLTLTTAGLPLQGIGYIVAIDRIIDMIRTATNVTGQILIPVLVAKEENMLDQSKYDGSKSMPTPLNEIAKTLTD